MAMNLFGSNDHPFYKPLWRRIVIVIVTALWAGFEVFYSGSGVWMVIASAIFIYAVWMFLIAYPKDDAAPP
jgi:hypothetical protein